MWQLVSLVVGWTYFACWSFSFYPQVYLNYTRKSVKGLSLDFVVYNLIGFTCYAVFTVAAYPHAARLNDVVFAVHAFCLCAITSLQCLAYDRGGQKVSRTCSYLGAAFIGAVGAFLVSALLVPGRVSWRSFFLALSFVKLCASVFKYIPQVLLNRRRRSTVGWSIGNVLLDISGGLLSLLQVAIDGLSRSDWSQVMDNPVKFLLGVVTIGFDTAFIVQHYVLYPASPEQQSLKV